MHYVISIGLLILVFGAESAILIGSAVLVTVSFLKHLSQKELTEEMISLLKDWDESSACGCQTSVCLGTCRKARTRCLIEKVDQK